MGTDLRGFISIKGLVIIYRGWGGGNNPPPPSLLVVSVKMYLPTTKPRILIASSMQLKQNVRRHV